MSFEVRFSELNRQGTQHLAAIRTQVDTIKRVIDRNQPHYTKAAEILQFSVWQVSCPSSYVKSSHEIEEEMRIIFLLVYTQAEI